MAGTAGTAVRRRVHHHVQPSSFERLRGFLQQGGGRLSKRARDQEFAPLTGAEAEPVETLYSRCFEPPGSEP